MSQGRHVVICNWRDSTHPQAGGAELYCERTADHLSRDGISVTLLTSRSHGTARQEATRYGQVVRRGGTLGVYFAALWWMLRRRRSIDGVIDSQNGIPFFSPLVVRRSTPVVLLIHHVHQQQFATHFRWPMSVVGQWLERTASRWVYGRRAICVVSPSSRSEVRRQLDFRGPVFLAPCGQDAPSARSAGRSGAPTIVVVGRLMEHKRLDLLLRALPDVQRSVTDLELHIVGDGPALSGLRELAVGLGLEHCVRFHGRVSDERRDALLDGAWLTVGTSAGEGWGLSIMEASARGIPAVAMRVPGLRDSVLHARTGWLVNDADGLADAVAAALRQLGDQRFAQRVAELCQEWAGRFSWAATADRLLAVLDAEAGRLQRSGGEHATRGTNDATTIVQLPLDAIQQLDLAALRRTDQVECSCGGVRILLSGADEHDALAALRRVGLPDTVVPTCRIARPSELLGWVARPADGAAGQQVPASRQVAAVEADRPWDGARA